MQWYFNKDKWWSMQSLTLKLLFIRRNDMPTIGKCEYYDALGDSNDKVVGSSEVS